MSKPALPILLLLLTGCMSEPLAPGFAGDWAPARLGCGGPRVTISKTGLTASGFPIEGLSFTSTKVSGNTADVVMELSPAAKAAYGAGAPKRGPREPDLAELEISATLVASGRLIAASNVLVRNKRTRHLSTAPADLLTLLRLSRCDGARA